VACLSTLPGAVAGRIVSSRRPKDAASALSLGLGGAALRFMPALVVLGWLSLPSTRPSVPPEAAIWLPEAATWLVVTYLVVLAADIGLHIVWGRRHTVSQSAPRGAHDSSPRSPT
jgi:hypothetical protein